MKNCGAPAECAVCGNDIVNTMRVDPEGLPGEYAWTCNSRGDCATRKARRDIEQWFKSGFVYRTGNLGTPVDVLYASFAEWYAIGHTGWTTKLKEFELVLSMDNWYTQHLNNVAHYSLIPGKPKEAVAPIDVKTLPTVADVDTRYVYFIQDATGRVKIGTSNDPRARCSELSTGSSGALTLISQCPGDEVLERWLHAKFAAQRCNGEWFTPSLEILALAMALR